MSDKCPNCKTEVPGTEPALCPKCGMMLVRDEKTGEWRRSIFDDVDE